MRLVPTSTASTPAAAKASMSARSLIPLSLTINRPSGTSGRSFRVVSNLTSKVRRFRLLMPIILASVAITRPSSSSSCTSTKQCMPRERVVFRRLTSKPWSKTAANNSTASAPATRAANTCNGSMIKSLHITGKLPASCAWRRYSGLPIKKSSSVITETAAAPPFS